MIPEDESTEAQPAPSSALGSSSTYRRRCRSHSPGFGRFPVRRYTPRPVCRRGGTDGDSSTVQGSKGRVGDTAQVPTLSGQVATWASMSSTLKMCRPLKGHVRYLLMSWRCAKGVLGSCSATGGGGWSLCRWPGMTHSAPAAYHAAVANVKLQAVCWHVVVRVERASDLPHAYAPNRC